MGGFLIILHVMICLFLILIVLLQAGKGADLGAAFGGSSQTAFGTRRGNILTRFTTICAILFMVTSFLLSFVFLPRPSIKKELLKKEVKVEEKVQKDKAKPNK